MDVLQDHIDVRATEQPKLPIRLCQRARTSGEDHLRAWTVFDGEVDTRQTWAVARVAGSQRAAPVVCSDLTLCLELSVLANSLFVYYCRCFL